ALEGPGHLRRPSYRDRPVPLPTYLVVSSSTTEALPPRVILADGVSIHPLAPDRWILEVAAAPMEQGRPVMRSGSAFLDVSPQALVERCIGTFGPHRHSHLGVSTPALLFEGLSRADGR